MENKASSVDFGSQTDPFEFPGFLLPLDYFIRGEEHQNLSFHPQILKTTY